VFGKLPTGPLAILKETWTGDRELPTDLNKTAVEDLRNKLEIAQQYANEHSTVAQDCYVSRHNLLSRDKHFSVGEKCLVLHRDNTANTVFSRWCGPAEIVEVKSPYSYIVALGNGRYHMHAC